MKSKPKIILPEGALKLFIKEVLVFEDYDNEKEVKLPFFADGFPGLLFHQSTNGMIVLPHNKKMPLIFLYGQTIHPIKLKLSGAYQVIILQLYPFVINGFFNIELNRITDNCFDLKSYDQTRIKALENELTKPSSLQNRIELIYNFLLEIFKQKMQLINPTVEKAVRFILNNKGVGNIEHVAEQANTTIRTLQRSFQKETGLTPKNFSKIVQFQTSLKQISEKEFKRLTDIVYENGFADQSHFIRVFKFYTGVTPSSFLHQQ